MPKERWVCCQTSNSDLKFHPQTANDPETNNGRTIGYGHEKDG